MESEKIIQQLETEITESKRMENALQESEEAYRSLFENNSVAIAIFEADKTISMVNEKYCQLSGYTKQEVVGMKWTHQLLPEELERLKEFNRKRLLNPEDAPESYEFQFLRKDGELRYATISIVVLNQKIVASFIDVTERRQMEQKLRENKEKYRRLVDNSHDIIFTLRADGKLIFVSPAWTALLGHSVNQVMGQQFQKFIHPEDLPTCSKFLQKVIKTGQKQLGVEYRVKHLDGGWRWHTTAAVPKKDENGAVVGFYGLARDITERKQRERREKLARKVLDRLNRLDSSQNMIHEILQMIKEGTDIEAVAIRLSKDEDYPYYATAGFSDYFIEMESPLCSRSEAGEIIRDSQGKPILMECMCGNILCSRVNPDFPFFTEGGSFWSNCLTDLWKGMTEEDRRKLRGRCHQEGYESIALIPLRSGEEIVGLLQLNDHQQNQFTPEIIRSFERLGISLGIAFSRQRAEKKLLDEKLFVESLIESIPGLFYVYDENGKFIRWNKQHETMTGYSAEELSQKTPLSWYAGEDVSRVEKAIAKVFSIGYGEVEASLIAKDGNKIFMRLNGMKATIGENSYLLGVGVDITKDKQMEKALIESERLKAIGELSSGVAHDFNNILQVIFGNVELGLILPNVPKEALKYFKAIKEATTDGASRVRQLQRFTSKEMSNNHRALDLCVLLEEVVLQTKPLWKDEAEKKGLKISFQKNYGETELIDGESGEIRTVFYNLLKNAVEAMPTGGKITLEAGVCEEEAVSYVRFSDNGIGMDEETKKRIFDPFFSTKGFEPGRGLGMNAVYTIILDHGGKIVVTETAVGKGTTIEIKIPFGKKLAEEFADDNFSEQEVSAKVLWVDDEEMIRTLGKGLLTQLGHSVDIAASGKEALALLEKNQHNPYDLMITDVGMPGMSGWQLAEVVKEKYVDLKVAVVTGWGANVSAEEKRKYGVGYVLGKPVSMMDLKNLIREALQSKI